MRLYAAMLDELMKIAEAKEHGGILLKDKTTAFPTDEGEPVAKNMDRRRDELVIRQGLQRNPTSPGGAEDIDYSAVRGLV
jgi:hypothetical protein